ncbi:MAG: iron-containing alcohol dehydrogenase [Anaerolineae bacterium]|nr:iron-containing alcohol dehydrogenase [Anaerolineae bacterium]
MTVWPLPRITFRALSSVAEARPAALITQPESWASVSAAMPLPIVIQAEPETASRDLFEHLAENLPSPVEVIYAVGEGAPFEAGRFIASRTHKPLVIVPTILSTNRAFVPDCAIVENGALTHLEAGPATELIIDLDVLKNAPAHRRAGALADVIAVITALMDWEHAEQHGKTTPTTRYLPWAAGAAAAYAGQALKIAGPLGQGDPDALRTLVDLIALLVGLDNQLGHRRASRGVERLFAESAAQLPSTAGTTPAERLGPGILLAAALYKKNSAALRTAVEMAGIRLNQMRPEDVRAVFMSLPDYARKVGATGGILDETTNFSEDLVQALSRSTLVTGG